ncbi:MAG TPA: type II toxin-antitoxin system mRNA interferase toxin, RelE/StbE family [Bryobacteraceae bacterium]|jgi:proteic killer suppression protein
MIRPFRHAGLKRMYRGDDRKVNAAQRARIRRVLAALDNAETIEELNLPGYRLHPLKGELKSFWSITISGNWRIIFRLEEENVFDVDLIDYHGD